MRFEPSDIRTVSHHGEISRDILIVWVLNKQVHNKEYSNFHGDNSVKKVKPAY